MTRVLTGLARRVRGSASVQWWAVFVPVLLAYLATVRDVASEMSADPTGVTPSAWGVAHHGSPIVAAADWPFFNPWFVTLGPDAVVSNRPPGLVYLATPAYWLFRGADTWEPLPASITAALVTAAAVATFGLLVRHLVGPGSGPMVGVGSALVAGLATTTWAVSGTQLFPHGPDQLLLVLAMAALAGRRRLVGPLGAGLALAAAVTIRPPLAAVAAALGLWRSVVARRFWPAVAIGASTALGLLLFAWYSHRYWTVVLQSGAGGAAAVPVSRGVLNGSATHGYFRSLTDWSPAAWAELAGRLVGASVSPGRGVFVGAPFLLLLLPGLRAAWRAAPDWVRAAAVGGLVYFVVQLKVETFTGGQYFWSYRYPLETLTLCAPLLVLSWRRWTARRRRRRAWFAALVSVAIGCQAVGAFGFHGPYPDTPWTFDNFGAALTGHEALPGWIALVVAAVVAAGLLWREYRPGVTARDRPASPTRR